MSKHWFKPKSYGYGFIPTTIEGWFCTAVLIFLVFLSAWGHHILEPSVTTRDAALFVVDLMVLCGVATLFFDRKTKGDLKWRWGKRK